MLTIIIRVVIIIKINTHNKRFTVQLIYCMTTNCIASPWAATTKSASLTDLRNFWFRQTCEFHSTCQTYKKKKIKLTHRKFQTPRKEMILPPGLLSMRSTVWNISTGQLKLAAWLCSLSSPEHLLISWVWETRRSPWFHSYSWKHQHYQHSSHTKSKTRKLLGGKLSPSQMKPGQQGKQAKYNIAAN